MNDPRKQNHPARGTKTWETKYKERSRVEQVNAYLKENEQFNDTRFYQSTQSIVFYHLIPLAYNVKTFVNQRLSKRKTEKKQS